MKRLFYNFKEMPGGLKLVTAASLFALVFVLITFNPRGHITVFGRYMAMPVWWASGAGVALSVILLLMVVSAILMLQRSPWGRPLQVLSWVALSGSVPLIAALTSARAPGVAPQTGFNLLLTLAIGAYLYGSKRVGEYFQERN